MTDDQVHSFYLLPWLRLRHAIAFGAVNVAPAEECLDDGDPRTDVVRRILATYKGLGGSPVAPSLMWRSGADPLGIKDEDFSVLAAHRDYLSAAAIMGNEYFEALNFPITDAHCDAYFQRFTGDGAHITLAKRRREGQIRDGWPLAQSATQIPLAASPGHQFNADQSLLDAFATLVTPRSDLDQRIENALPFFVQANRLSERTPVQYDLVFLGAAFERMFGVHTRVTESLANAVAVLFAHYQQGSTNWQNRSLAGNLSPDSGPWVKRWVREFYAHRSSIHGAVPPHSNEWRQVWHGLLATEVFSLSVKVLLDQAGTRRMTETDSLAADALDARIEYLAGVASGDDATDKWRLAHQEAVHRSTVAAAARSLPENATALGSS